MSIFNISDMVDFPECFRTALYESHGDGESESYAYYQGNRILMFQAGAEKFNLDDDYFKVHAAISRLECAYFTNKDINCFEVIKKKSGDEITLLSRQRFYEVRNAFYENDGRRIGPKKEPMIQLYFSNNILVYLGVELGISLFNGKVILNEFAKQMDVIYKEMRKRNYHFSEETTVKEFYRDIIVHVYPEMSKHDQNYCWRFFKSQGGFTVL